MIKVRVCLFVIGNGQIHNAGYRNLVMLVGTMMVPKAGFFLVCFFSLK